MTPARIAELRKLWTAVTTGHAIGIADWFALQNALPEAFGVIDALRAERTAWLERLSSIKDALPECTRDREWIEELLENDGAPVPAPVAVLKPNAV